MKKLICILFVFATSVLFLLAAERLYRNYYRHIRTNKKAWVRLDVTSSDPIIPGSGYDKSDEIDEIAPEIYFSDDSLLIVSELQYEDIEVVITDYLNNDAEMLSVHYDKTALEERISIIDFPDGIYKITIMDNAFERILYGYFPKGEQYMQEAESLGIPSLSIDKTPNNIYNISGRKLEKTGKGIYIINGRKVVRRG